MLGQPDASEAPARGVTGPRGSWLLNELGKPYAAKSVAACCGSSDCTDNGSHLDPLGIGKMKGGSCFYFHTGWRR